MMREALTARARVQRGQRRLIAALVVAGLLWAASAAMGVLVVAVGVSRVIALPPALRVALLPGLALAALGAAGASAWRSRSARSLQHVALWIEEQDPQLGYALVTAMDPTIAPVSEHPELHTIAHRVDIERLVMRAWRRRVGVPAVLCLGLVAVLVVLGPAGLLHAATQALTAARAPAPMANRLVPLTATVVAPAYSRLPVTMLREPARVAVLIGSQVVLTGSGPATGVTAHADSLPPLTAHDSARGWAMRVPVPTTAVVLTLHDRTNQRLVALEPIPDSAPTVRLTLPARDTTYQTVPHGSLAIAAELRDDIGLNAGYVEYLISKGAEETFETKQVESPRVRYNNARHGVLETAIDLDTMRLGPGSVLHIRVVAYDYNDVTGPGKGVSETRTLRVAEPVDSMSINAAPPLPIDSMWVSQRLLNMRTDTLVATRRTLDHEGFVHASAAYSNTQETIRQRALAVIALLEDNGVGGAFQTEASTKLRAAVDLMWTAREDLGIAHPDSAQPIMRQILKILDDLRLAHRYYLRGQMPPVAVNVARVRLTGKDSAQATARRGRAGLEDPQTPLARRLEAVRTLAWTAPQVAADSLVFLRVSALTTAPRIVAALQTVMERLHAGTPADRAVADSVLARTVRALEPKATMTSGGTPWAR